jgi:large-conductance mechanosensitive channel
MIEFACVCGRALQTPDELAGRQIRCPSCSEVQTVPGESTPLNVEEPVAPRPEPPRRFRPVLARDDEEQSFRGPPERTSAKSAWSLGLGISSFVLFLVTGIPAIILGGMAISEINQSRGRVGGQGMAIGGVITGVIGSLLTLVVGVVVFSMMVIAPAMNRVQTAVVRAQQQAVQAQSKNNLALLGTAMDNFATDTGAFPPAAGGKNMDVGLSWRVALLPHLGETALYRQFHLDEPWDSPHNKRLQARMPYVYTIPGVIDPPGMTRYRVFVGKRAAFEKPEAGAKTPPRGRRLADFPDVTETILVFEAADAVPWTKPDELEYAPDRPLPSLSRVNGGPKAVMADGTTIRFLDPNATTDAEFRAMIDRDGKK